MKKLLIIVPVYNEEKILKESISKIKNFFDKKLSSEEKNNFSYDIAIAGRSSTDRTNEIAQELEEIYDNVFHSTIDHPEKGGRIRDISIHTDYDFYAFIDCDLPIRLEDFYAIISEVIFNSVDMAVASKYVHGAQQNRPFIRIIISQCYNFLVRMLFPQIKIKDQFCGAKAWNKNVAVTVLPLVKNTHYFFDSELIYLCFENGYKVVEVPVIYSDTRPDSKVNIFTDSFTVGRDLIKFFIEKRIFKK